MRRTMTHVSTLVTEECCSCHIIFAMPKYLQDQARAAGPGKSFYCPLGHAQHYSVREVDRLRRELEAERELVQAARAAAQAADDQAQAAIRSARAIRGHLTRARKRIANGVCPCCNRSFPNLRDHMAAKHPGYQESEGA